MKQPHSKLVEKEKDVQRAILDYLAATKVFHYRNNSGAAVLDNGKRFIRFGAPGSPDIVCVIEGRYIAVEVKGTKGVQSDNQKEFERRLTEAGGVYILVRSLDDFIREVNKL